MGFLKDWKQLTFPHFCLLILSTMTSHVLCRLFQPAILNRCFFPSTVVSWKKNPKPTPLLFINILQWNLQRTTDCRIMEIFFTASIAASISVCDVVSLGTPSFNRGLGTLTGLPSPAWTAPTAFPGELLGAGKKQMLMERVTRDSKGTEGLSWAVSPLGRTEQVTPPVLSETRRKKIWKKYLFNS